MNPRSSITFLGLLALLSLGFATFVHAQAEPTFTLRFATLAPPGSEPVRGLERWGQQLRRATGGRLAFRIYAGGVQGDDAQLVRKLQSGRIDVAALSGAGLGQVYLPALALSLPGLVHSYEELDRARDAVSADLEAGARENGFTILGWFDVGRARVMSTSPIRTPSDLSGKRMWSRPGELMLPTLISAAHASGVSLEVPEVFGALSTGRLDVVTAPPLAAVALAWASRLRYVTDAPLSIVYGATVASSRAIDALPADIREAVLTSARPLHAEARRRGREADEQAMQTLLSHGMQRVSTSDADRAAWIQMGRAIRGQVAASVAPAGLVARLEAAVAGH